MDTQVVKALMTKLALVSTGIIASASLVNAENYLALQGLYPWDCVEENTLSQSRGGFVFSNGVEIDVGIRRNLSVSGGANLSDGFMNNLNTPGYAATSIPLSSGSTIIRNSLDNLNIRNTTIFDVRIRNLGSFKNPQTLLPDFYVPTDPSLFNK